MLVLLVDGPRVLDVVVHTRTGAQLLATAADRPNRPGEDLLEVGELLVDVDVAVPAQTVGLGVCRVDDAPCLGLGCDDHFILGDQALLLGDAVGHRALVVGVGVLDDARCLGTGPAGDRLVLAGGAGSEAVRLLGGVGDQYAAVARRVVDHAIGGGAGLADEAVGLGARSGDHGVGVGLGGGDGGVGILSRVPDDGITLVEDVLCVVQFGGMAPLMSSSRSSTSPRGPCSPRSWGRREPLRRSRPAHRALRIRGTQQHPLSGEKATSVAAVTIVQDVTNVIWDAFSVRRVVSPPHRTAPTRCAHRPPLP